MFSLADFEKLKRHVKPGTLGLAFTINRDVEVSLNDKTAHGRGWELRMHHSPTRRMCILTERDGQLSADYRRLVPKPGGYDFQPLADPAFEREAPSLLLQTLAHLEQREAADSAAGRRAATTLLAQANDAAAMQRWRELVAALVSDGNCAEAVADETLRAFAEPERFVEPLQLEGVSDKLPWFALIEALKEETRLAEFDWREEPDDIADALDSLCEAAGVDAIDWDAVDLDGSAAEVLNAASAALAEGGHMLVCLDAESDSFPTALIKKGSFETAKARAASFGCAIKREFA